MEVRSGCHECSVIPVDQFRDPTLDAVKLANERIKKLAARRHLRHFRLIQAGVQAILQSPKSLSRQRPEGRS